MESKEKNWQELYEKIANLIHEKYGLDKKEVFQIIQESEKSMKQKSISSPKL
jgi:mannitol/fructose-specific phosphotransferase system IIA component (Ntr-type)